MQDADGALADLRDWARRRAALEENRPALMLAAWQAGGRNVAALARAAGVARDTVYADLRRAGIEFYSRS
jgi:transcriptional regulator of acetoin/glycerol metabolism